MGRNISEYQNKPGVANKHRSQQKPREDERKHTTNKTTKTEQTKQKAKSQRPKNHNTNSEPKTNKETSETKRHNTGQTYRPTETKSCELTENG
jgi:hypothetical protein